jgi:hypothetical protein
MQRCRVTADEKLLETAGILKDRHLRCGFS